MQKAIRKIFVLYVLLLALNSCAGSYFKYLRQAEEYSRKKEYSKAIEAYKKHIKYRLAQEERPKWENPYFYYLIIGDIYLGMNKPKKAIKAYSKAEKKGVDAGLVADRYRLVARWYEKQNKLEEAFDLLLKNRERDSLLFDIMLDRIAKKISALEDQQNNSENTPATSEGSAEKGKS
ncbi:MAG: hypothetical protein D6719_04830 [Candidatus Dadabacteria bacterium]|nr:MAG: hypothetical protein D6719_04830 [Candidatus Dadabacteria bacterium]